MLRVQSPKGENRCSETRVSSLIMTLRYASKSSDRELSDRGSPSVDLSLRMQSAPDCDDCVQ